MAAKKPDESKHTEGKGHATPTRKQQEALRKRPLVLDTKKNSKARRQKGKTQRQREYDAMQNGDAQNMPPQHAGLVRKFARDYIDSRLTIGEFMLPITLVALGIMMFGGALDTVVAITGLAIMLLFFTWIVETILVVNRMRKAAIEKFGADKVTGAYRWYGLQRLSQMRVLRMPKPQVRRGERPS